MPKVSVIIPNYNHARFLEQRFRSVLDQTFQDFEIIYLDDASTDESNEVFAQFAGDPRIRAVFNKTNSGSPFIQWNKGVRMAQGEYLWMAESDDYADLRFLEVLVERLDRLPHVGIVYCRSYRVDEEGKVAGYIDSRTSRADAGRWERDFVCDGREECVRRLAVRNTILNASAALLRKKVYEEAGYAEEGLVLAGDWQLWVKMLRLSDLAFVSAPLNYFRIHECTVRNELLRTGAYIEENYRVLQYILKELDVPRHVVTSALDWQASLWLNCALRERRPMTWEQHRRICRLAKEIDPHPVLRLAKNLVMAPLREALGLALRH